MTNPQITQMLNMNNYELSIVIGTLNRPQTVLKLLKELLKERQKLNFEVMVFDQSTNENYQNLLSKFPKQRGFTHFHFTPNNTPRYLNMGWQKAKSPLVLYLDDDVSLTPDTLSTHLKAYENAAVLGVAGRVINDGEKLSSSSTVGKVLFFGAGFVQSFSSLKGQSVDFPYGCNMSFRKSALETLAGFDERLAPPVFAYNEVDLGYRLNKLSPHSLVFAPQALVYHHRAGSGGTRDSKNQSLIAKGNAFNYGYFVGKNFSCAQNLLFLMRRLPYQILREPNLLLPIIKGLLAGKKILSPNAKQSL
jgi:GT2 family glycosyltransferase